ncbi:alpha/beta hydrolase [Solimonas sp. K1W22B-7]|uniref:alpha/beta fold hydrolase n=1 Tax=Solimonas sp. K1W22B-7 TaxID=2303331 RepID=UPI000E3370EF|nr:alpha/beta hydrolase [Solimonas sp. K1W22B-7]AXQ29391.1 alpha/beta hydrolase [Solimonas sp. K1W22B-7]
MNDALSSAAMPSYPDDALPRPEVYEGGAGTPLVLIHGFGGNWRMWKPVLPLLEKHHRVIVPTLPGHSGGLPLSRRATPAVIADALAVQLRSRGLDQVHVVGQSLGGYMAVEMARRGLARSVLGISPGGAWKDDSHQQALLKRIRGTFKLMPYLLPLLRLLIGFKFMRKLILRDEMQHGDKMSVQEVRGMLHHGLNCSIAHEFLDDGIAQIEPLPRDNTTPVRIVWCQNDRVLTFPEFGQPFLDRLGLKTNGWLPGCGHNPMYDDPAGVAKAILDFTRAVESGRPQLS